MKYLLDTNIFLEVMLHQEHENRVRRFFENTDPASTCMSDLTLHSIGIILFNRGKAREFCEFVEETILEEGIRILRPAPMEMKDVAEFAERYGLDFDDAYQYAVAEKFDLKIVSLDKDVDRTHRGRVIPGKSRPR